MLDDAEANTLRVLEVYCDIMEDVKAELEKANEINANDFMMQLGTDIMVDTAASGLNGDPNDANCRGTSKVQDLNHLLTSIQASLHKVLDQVQSLEPVKYPAYHPISAEGMSLRRSHQPQ